MFLESMKNIFSRLKKFRVNKLILFLIAVALCAIALAFIICYIMSTAHPPVNIEVNLHLTENYAGLESNPILGAAAGLVGSVINWQSQREANKMNMKINQMNNEFNRVEAAKQRDWQTVEWLRQFNAENAYNSPKNQMARLQMAGINPFIAAETTTKIGSTAANPSVPSAASATAASPLAMHAPNFDLSPLVQMAQAASLMASAKKDTAATNEINETLAHKVKLLREQGIQQELQNKVFSKYGDTEAANRCYLLSVQALEALSQRDLNNVTASQVREQIQKLIKENKSLDLDLQIKEGQMEWLIKLVQEQYNTQVATTETTKKQGVMYEKQGNAAIMQGQAAMSQAASAAFMAAKQGKYYDALTQTENLIREFRVSAADAEQANKWSDFLYNIGTLKYRIESEHWNSEKVFQEVQKLEKELNNFAQGHLGQEFNDLKRIVHWVTNGLRDKLGMKKLYYDD